MWQGLLEARQQGCAIVMISAELEEIMNLSDRIAVMYEGQIAGVLNACEASVEHIGELMAGGRLSREAS